MQTKTIARRTSKPGSSTSAFGALQSIDEFQAANAHVFPSVPSLRWFYQQHRAELLRAGAVVELAGRLKINGPIFAAAALTIGQQTAVNRKRSDRA